MVVAHRTCDLLPDGPPLHDAAARKQSGGHGQFGDIVVDIKPLPRGSGFQFAEFISGGAVPRQYFTSVEEG